jgi:hypothetical protein
MTTNPESAPEHGYWSPDDYIHATERMLGLATASPGAEPNGICLGFVIDHPVLHAMGMSALQVAANLNLEEATEFYEEFGEVLMLLRVARAAAEAS